MSLLNTLNVTMDTLRTQWNTNRNYVQLRWDRLLSVLGDDPFTMWFVVTISLQLIVYWGYGSFFVILDSFNHHAFIKKFKIQPRDKSPDSKKILIKALMFVLINQILVGIPVTYLGYKMFMLRGMPPIHELPTFHTFIFDLVILALLEEVALYYSHRLFHTKYLYKHFHKKHHEWTTPIAITAMYSHPVEHIFSIVSPVLIQIFLVKAHLLTAWIYFILVSISILNDHSGYDFPSLKNSVRFHDLHHSKLKCNYGIFGLLDKIHGTYKEENTMLQLKRRT